MSPAGDTRKTAAEPLPGHVRPAVARAQEHDLPMEVPSALVNRTHRVVRERAKSIAAQRRRTRSLYLPVAVSAVLVAAVVFAVWSLLDQYEVNPNGLPDASQQLMVLSMWCLPVTAAVLAAVWFRKPGSRADGDPREGVR